MPITSQLEEEALGLFVELLKVDTSNPPGNERPAADLLAAWLRADGYEPTVLESAPGRANLVVRRKGSGAASPLLLTGHLDVVPAPPEGWRHPPFAGVIDDGWLYGRGAVDMKNHVAACAAVMRSLARDNVALKRDVIFAAVADEEHGCAHGASFLAERHTDLIQAEWALGEVGGFTLPIGSKRLYPIQVANRGTAWMRMTAKGPSGHGSLPRDDSSVMKLARATMRLGNRRLPVHPTPAAGRMLDAFGAARGAFGKVAMGLARLPAFTDLVLDNFVSDPAVRRNLNSSLRNTVAVTNLRAGVAPNVIPGTAEATLDGRTLPGQTTQDVLREVREVVDDPDIELSVFQQLPPVESPHDSDLYRILAEALREIDPEAVPFPYLMTGFTDASAFARLGMKFYGFAPIWFAPEHPVSFSELFHGVDERIPVEGFRKGLRALHSAVGRFCA